MKDEMKDELGRRKRGMGVRDEKICLKDVEKHRRERGPASPSVPSSSFWGERDERNAR